METKSHIAIFPTPGMGHLIPLVQFAKRLISLHKFTATFIITTDGPLSKSQTIFLDTLPTGLDYVVLPPVSLDDLPNDVMAETRMSVMISRSLPALRDMFKSIFDNKKLVSFVADLFATDALDVAIEFKVSPFIFFTSTAMTLSFFLHSLPKFDEMTSCEYRELADPVQIPGCVPVHGRDILDPVQDRKNDAYKWVLHHTKRYVLADGIMVNSFNELEEGAIKALQELGSPPVYPVGPLVQMDRSSGADGSGCLRWLDDQPRGSVLFISFGSGGTLSSNQITELAMGLEMSEQRFLWVVRSPDDESADAAFFNSYSKKDPVDFLPQGFTQRTKGHGLVVPDWAPQAQILSHGSTGGFLTHCGWNSILETVVNGVPIIAWPLYAEQRMNAVMLSEGLKVALRPHVGENGLVGRVEIATVVKGLMEGEEGKRLRTRMRNLKDAAANVLSEDGSSTKAMAQVVSKWTSS